MKNPWLELNMKNAPYVLDSDKEIINNFNNKVVNKDYLIRTDNLPTPYAGDFKKAKILLLQLNPGSEIHHGLEPTENHEFEVYPNLISVLEKSLRHESMDYPFFWLNPEFMLTGGFRYWARMFSQVIKTEKDYKNIANKVCCVQYFPYHSRKYQDINKIVDSQKYTASLVEEFASQPNRMVILMRASNQWQRIVDLDKLKVITLKSKQNPVLTRNNFKNEDDFNQFLEYLNY